MTFYIDFKSGRPFYLQLVDQVRYAGASGALRPKDPLPSIRSVAKQVRINRNTVAKAYAELEGLSIIQTIIGAGCFLREHDSPLTQPVRRKLLAAKIDEAVVTAHQMQVGHDTLREIIEERIQFFESKKNGRKSAVGKARPAPGADAPSSSEASAPSTPATPTVAPGQAAGTWVPTGGYLD